MKTVTRLVTEDPIRRDTKGKPILNHNDYNSTAMVGGKTVDQYMQGDNLLDKGAVVNIAHFEYGDDENPTVLA